MWNDSGRPDCGHLVAVHALVHQPLNSKRKKGVFRIQALGQDLTTRSVTVMHVNNWRGADMTVLRWQHQHDVPDDTISAC